MKTVSVELPDEILELFDTNEIDKILKELAILELVKTSKLSSGKAAEILGIGVWDFMELMSKYNIPMANFSKEELRRQAQEMEKEAIGSSSR